MAYSPTSFPPRTYQRPGARHTGPVFAVGRRAFVNGAGSRGRSVDLADEKGAAIVGSLPDGTEVEILGWLPRGAATRYHVRSTKDRIAGWVGADSLRQNSRRQTPEIEAKSFAKPVSIPPEMPSQAGAATAAAIEVPKRPVKTIGTKKRQTARKRSR